MARFGSLHFHKGAACWYVRVDGRMTYAPRSVVSETDAQQWLERIKLQKGGVDGGLTPDDAKVMTLIDVYLSHVQGESGPKNYKDKVRILTRFAGQFGQRTLRSLTPLEVSAWIRAWPRRTSGGGQRQVHAHLAGLFNALAPLCRCTMNPLKGIKRARACARTDDYVIDPAGWDLMWPLLAQPYQDAARVLWASGARPSEILAADCEEYSPGTIHKRHHKTEGQGQTRHILLPNGADAIVRGHIGDRKDGRIFRTPGCRPLSVAWLNESLQTVARRIGRTKPVCAYSLRHSFCVRHLRNRVPIAVVAGWMGHSVAVCARHYAHIASQLEGTRDLLGD